MGAHRQTQCPQCPQTFHGPKSLVALDLREHFLQEHAPKPEPIVRTHCEEVGHKCREHEDSIVVLINGFCGYCFRHPKPQYEWYEPGGNLLPFWRSIAKPVAA